MRTATGRGLDNSSDGPDTAFERLTLLALDSYYVFPDLGSYRFCMTVLMSFVGSDSRNRTVTSVFPKAASGIKHASPHRFESFARFRLLDLRSTNKLAPYHDRSPWVPSASTVAKKMSREDRVEVMSRRHKCNARPAVAVYIISPVDG